MKINGLNQNTPIERASGGKSSGPAAAGSAKGSSSSVSISDLASQLHSIEAELSTSEPFDAGKVEEIKQAMRDGQFKVNPGVVADRLIESMKELLAKPAQ